MELTTENTPIIRDRDLRYHEMKTIARLMRSHVHTLYDLPDPGGGETVEDCSGNSHHATLHNPGR